MKWLIPAVLLALVAVLLYLWLSPAGSDRESLLAWMPASAESVLFVDLSDLKRAPFFADLRSWAPTPETDPEYQQFVQKTGFNYEADLQRVAVGFVQQGAQHLFFGVADGRFDQRKIKTYAIQNGAQHTSQRLDTFSVPATGSRPQISFCFFSKNRIAFTNQPGLESFLDAHPSANSTDWRARFDRVSGSPIFLILNNDGLKSAIASDSAPQELARSGGFTAPQLATLLAQLQWLTLAGKPENSNLRIVAEAESLDEPHAHQLADFLNGLLLLARAGLATTNPHQLSTATRDSYITLLKTVEVTQLDRGDTKSVRLMFLLTPGLLQSVPLPPNLPARP